MLRQYDFAFSAKGTEKIYSEIAVKIHGAVMNSIPDIDAKRLHDSRYHPFAIYSLPSEDGKNIITRVSALNSDGDVIVNTAFRMNSILIKGLGRVDIIQNDDIYEKELSALADELMGRNFRLVFLTPSSFKVSGKETGFPDVTMHFLSVIRKMNEFEGENIDFDEFRKAFYKCRIGDWAFHGSNYNVSGVIINGMTGYVDIMLPDSQEQRMLKKVFAYASFSGTGGKTGMGMGGFFFQKR